MGLRPPKVHTFGVYTCHWYHWFAVKPFLYGCAQDTVNPAIFGSDSAIVTFLPEFFLFYVFATEIAQGRCMYTTGVAVHFSAFRLLGYAFAPSFLAIFTFLVRFGKMNFIVEFNKFFYVR